MSEAKGADETAPTLWRHGDFLRLWSASAISGFGARITREGLPMAAVASLGAMPGQVGILAACAMAPAVAVGLFGGSRIDRARKKPVLVGADILRALTLALLPLAALGGWLSLPLVCAVAAVVGALNVVFDMAHHAFLPSLIPRDALLDGNAKLASTDSVAEVGGPALAGVLFQALTAPIAVAVNAATYLASAAFLFTLKGQEAPPEPAEPEHWLADMTSGVRAAFAHPLVRPMLLMSLTQSLFGSFFAALYVIYALKVLGMTQALLGIAVAAGGLGGLLGALIAPRMTKLIGIGPALIGAAMISGAIALATPLAPAGAIPGTATLVFGQFFGDAFAVASVITASSLRQSVLPGDVLARVAGAFHALPGLLGIFGALIGGLLGETIGPRHGLLVAAIGFCAAPLWVLASPLRRLRTVPSEDAAPA